MSTIRYDCWIETKPPGATTWQHYEDLWEEVGLPGVYVADEAMCDGVNDLAQRVLGDYLMSVLSAYPGQRDVQVRACAQVGGQTSVGYSAICQASPHDLAKAHEVLQRWALTDDLRSACHGLHDARRGLEAAVVKAHAGGLARGTVTHIVAALLDGQSVARLIDASGAQCAADNETHGAVA